MTKTCEHGAAELHPTTEKLVDDFAAALKAKLAAAEQKYGYSDGWAQPGWADECRAHLREHIQKGDPRDVANYCAFLWYHGEPTYLAQQGSGEGGVGEPVAWLKEWTENSDVPARRRVDLTPELDEWMRVTAHPVKVTPLYAAAPSPVAPVVEKDARMSTASELEAQREREYDCLRAVYEAARGYLRDEAEPAKQHKRRAILDYAIEDVKLIDGGYEPEGAPVRAAGAESEKTAPPK